MNQLALCSAKGRVLVKLNKINKMDLSFFKSNRFWVLVIGCATLFVEGGFTFDSLLRALSAFCLGFIGVRTVDRFGEKVGAK